MDCGMLLAPAVRLLARNTLDVAPLLLPLLVFTLVASPFVALVLKAGLKKSWIYALEWILLKLSQGHPGGPQSVKRGLKRAVTGAVGHSAFASGAFWLTTIACMAPAMAVRCSSCKDNHLPAHDTDACPLTSGVTANVAALAAASGAIVTITQLLPSKFVRVLPRAILDAIKSLVNMFGLRLHPVSR